MRSICRCLRAPAGYQRAAARGEAAEGPGGNRPPAAAAAQAPPRQPVAARELEGAGVGPLGDFLPASSSAAPPHVAHLDDDVAAWKCESAVTAPPVAAAERQRVWEKCRGRRGHDPAGNQGSLSLAPAANLRELMALFPESSVEVLEIACRCCILEDALDMIIDSMVTGKLPSVEGGVPSDLMPKMHEESGAHSAAIYQVVQGYVGGSVTRSIGLPPPALRKEQHIYVAVTLGAPSWCKECQVFLWGLSHQGKRCTVCHQVVCCSCAEAHREGCSGESDDHIEV
eukprot:TRINITY_DN22754_c0_g2_i2.p1 TRINITY_DN22754_c0_g2~~TRINITY_DN22754_c0_g2_i2.p1  ORF type:complete len:284 (+),score=47.50 TRINITY_DN22754_c0_g2_i2:36-887(+)